MMNPSKKRSSSGMQAGGTRRTWIAPFSQEATLARSAGFSFFGMHWDHEPRSVAARAPAPWTAPVLWRFCNGDGRIESARGLGKQNSERGLPCARVASASSRLADKAVRAPSEAFLVGRGRTRRSLLLLTLLAGTLCVAQQEPSKAVADGA